MRDITLAVGKARVTKLEVAGTDADGERTLFDILDYRLVKEMTVTIKRDRQLTYNKRIAGLNTVHGYAKDEIAKLFKAENE